MAKKEHADCSFRCDGAQIDFEAKRLKGESHYDACLRELATKRCIPLRIRSIDGSRLGLTPDEYTRIGKALRDAAGRCKTQYSGTEQKACVKGISEVIDAMNTIGFTVVK